MAISDRFTPGLADGTANVFPVRYQTLSEAGDVTIASGVVFITSTASIAASIDAPPTTMDGARLNIINVGGAASTLTNVSSAGFNSGGTASAVATFTTDTSAGLVLHAYNGIWYRLESSIAIADS